MLALFDGDIVAYRAACSIEDIPTLAELAAMELDVDAREGLIKYEPVGFAFARMNETINNTLASTGATDYIIYLSGDVDFRVAINPDYKANRKDVRRPKFLQDCREYLVTQYKTEVTDGIEADDALGIMQVKCSKEGKPSVICSIDKDLLQIPGLHYNFVKQEFKEVDYVTGQKFLWKQMLIGDTADNILGISGIGPKKADKLIDPLELDQCYETVYDLYNDHERFNMNLKCLTILTEPLYEEKSRMD